MIWRIYQGDCLDIMGRHIEDKSVQTCITSPPYFNLRDYGVDEQIGLEQTPEQYVAKLVEVFREVRRVLRDDGTLWLNLGDSYANDSRWGGQTTGKHAASLHGKTPLVRAKRSTGLKSKDLIGIPWRVALALQADGWYLRQDIIWYKPNPMPESVRDRCTKAHEYLFLLAKSKRYYFDGDAIAQPCKPSTIARTNGPMKACFGGRNKYSGYGTRIHSGREDSGTYIERGANKRSVWTVTTKPFKGAHFATFPIDLIEPCILAGSKPGDTVLDPFGGAGTTALAATKHNRNAVLCEINPEYIEIAKARLAAAGGSNA